MNADLGLGFDLFQWSGGSVTSTVNAGGDDTALPADSTDYINTDVTVDTIEIIGGTLAFNANLFINFDNLIVREEDTTNNPTAVTQTGGLYIVAFSIAETQGGAATPRGGTASFLAGSYTLASGASLSASDTITIDGGSVTVSGDAVFGGGDIILNSGMLTTLAATGMETNDGLVDLGDRDSTFTMSGGVLAASVSMGVESQMGEGGGADNFIWSGGTVSGAVDLGDEADILTLSGTAGTFGVGGSFDGGAGSDTIVLSGSSDLTLDGSKFTGFEELSLESNIAVTLSSSLTIEELLTIFDGTLNVASGSVLTLSGSALLFGGTISGAGSLSGKHRRQHLYVGWWHVRCGNADGSWC